MEEVSWIEEDYFTERYPVTPDLLERLGLTLQSTPEEFAKVYRDYGIDLPDWAEIRLVGQDIQVHGYKEHHEQVAGINHLLSKGFKIVKE